MSGKPIDGVAAAEAEPWEFAGWGHAERISDLHDVHLPIRRLDQPHKHTLGTWRATAICGNDITSSVLYVSALCAAQAGVLAPLVLLVVAGVLYLYRKVYAEVGSALPLNGGTYTVLLNTTNKRVAAGAACLTLLSYIATAVISANEGMHYAHNLWAPLTRATWCSSCRETAAGTGASSTWRRRLPPSTRLYPASDFEALSRYLRKKLDFPSYRIPVLVGYSSGATLVYATALARPLHSIHPKTSRRMLQRGVRSSAPLPRIQ